MIVPGRILISVLAACWFVAGASSALGQEGDLIWNGKEWVSPKPAEPGSPEGDLALLRQMVDEGRGRKTVIKAVEGYLVEHGDSPLCEEAMNLAGQSLMNRGLYWEAYKWYERQISSYPNGRFFERALDREFQIADAFLNGRKRRAMKIFRVPAQDDGVEMLLRIATVAPGAKIAERSSLRVADYHFHRAEYDEAIKVYDDFIQTYARSENHQYAMLQVARAYLLSYRGVQWDDSPLRNAHKRFELFAQAYPKAAEEENIPGILEEIRLSLAQKVYQIGRFYERTKHVRAAAFYYRKVMREYPDTHWAKSAKGRIDLLGPLPVDAQPFTPPPPREMAEASDAPPQGPAEGPVEEESGTPSEAPPEEPAPQSGGPEPIPLEDLTTSPRKH